MAQHGLKFQFESTFKKNQDDGECSEGVRDRLELAAAYEPQERPQDQTGRHQHNDVRDACALEEQISDKRQGNQPAE